MRLTQMMHLKQPLKIFTKRQLLEYYVEYCTIGNLLFNCLSLHEEKTKNENPPEPFIEDFSESEKGKGLCYRN